MTPTDLIKKVEGLDGPLTDAQLTWLKRIAETGTWPVRPFLNDKANSVVLMRKGLIEAVAPEGREGYSTPLPYAAITPAGLALLRALEARERGDG